MKIVEPIDGDETPFASLKPGDVFQYPGNPKYYMVTGNVFSHEDHVVSNTVCLNDGTPCMSSGSQSVNLFKNSMVMIRK